MEIKKLKYQKYKMIMIINNKINHYWMKNIQKKLKVLMKTAMNYKVNNNLKNSI